MANAKWQVTNDASSAARLVRSPVRSWHPRPRSSASRGSRGHGFSRRSRRDAERPLGVGWCGRRLLGHVRASRGSRGHGFSRRSRSDAERPLGVGWCRRRRLGHVRAPHAAHGATNSHGGRAGTRNVRWAWAGAGGDCLASFERLTRVTGPRIFTEVTERRGTSVGGWAGAGGDCLASFERLTRVTGPRILTEVAQGRGTSVGRGLVRAATAWPRSSASRGSRGHGFSRRSRRDAERPLGVGWCGRRLLGLLRAPHAGHGATDSHGGRAGTRNVRWAWAGAGGAGSATFERLTRVTGPRILTEVAQGRGTSVGRGLVRAAPARPRSSASRGSRGHGFSRRSRRDAERPLGVGWCGRRRLGHVRAPHAGHGATDSHGGRAGTAERWAWAGAGGDCLATFERLTRVTGPRIFTEVTERRGTSVGGWAGAGGDCLASFERLTRVTGHGFSRRSRRDAERPLGVGWCGRRLLGLVRAPHAGHGATDFHGGHGGTRNVRWAWAGAGGAGSATFGRLTRLTGPRILTEVAQGRGTSVGRGLVQAAPARPRSGASRG
jgi:hypothetical protein